MSLDEKTRHGAVSQSITSPPQSSATSQTLDHGSAVDEAHQKETQALSEKQPQVSQQTAPAISPPPNGGRVAWTQVLCGFLLFFNTFGILTSFGVFQTYYESSSSTFRQSHSDISWIGSIQAFLLQFSGFIAGPIYDRGYIRWLLAFGSFGVVFGHMMLSISSSYWQVLLSQGFCVGLGMGCLYVPSISILPTYFSTRLGLAIGLASAGSAVGGVIYPIVMQRLLEQVGFGWAVRVVGFIALMTLSVPLALMKMRFKPAKTRAMIDWTTFTDPAFMWFAVATAIGFMGLCAFQIFFAFYAVEQNITTTNFSFSLVSIYNGMSAIGRIIPNAISDKVGQFNILTPAVLIAGAIYVSTIAVHSQGSMIAVTCLAGFFLGILTALPPVCFAILTKDKSRLGTRIGTGFAIIAFGVLASGPVAGAILQRSQPLDWSGLYAFTGVSMLISGSMYGALRVKRSGIKPWIKA